MRYSLTSIADVFIVGKKIELGSLQALSERCFELAVDRYNLRPGVSEEIVSVSNTALDDYGIVNYEEIVLWVTGMIAKDLRQLHWDRRLKIKKSLKRNHRAFGFMAIEMDLDATVLAEMPKIEKAEIENDILLSEPDYIENPTLDDINEHLVKRTKTGR